MRLKDGTRLVDHGDALTASSSSDVAVQLMALEALGKGWTHCRVEGSEAFLRKIARACFVLDIALSGATEEMQAILEEELGRLDPRSASVAVSGPAAGAPAPVQPDSAAADAKRRQSADPADPITDPTADADPADPLHVGPAAASP